MSSFVGVSVECVLHGGAEWERAACQQTGTSSACGARLVLTTTRTALSQAPRLNNFISPRNSLLAPQSTHSGSALPRGAAHITLASNDRAEATYDRDEHLQILTSSKSFGHISLYSQTSPDSIDSPLSRSIDHVNAFLYSWLLLLFCFVATTPWVSERTELYTQILHTDAHLGEKQPVHTHAISWPESFVDKSPHSRRLQSPINIFSIASIGFSDFNSMEYGSLLTYYWASAQK